MLYKFWDEMFNTQGESTTLADMNGGSSAAVAAYTPKYNGRLVAVKLLWAGEAVTSLMENVRVEMNCSIWMPNIARFGLVGANIRTAPAVPVRPEEWDVDLPAITNQGITAQYIYADAATPITCNLRVFGQFIVNA